MAQDVGSTQAGDEPPVSAGVATVLALLDAFSRGDDEALLAGLHDEIEFIPMLVATGARRAPYKGHEGFLAYLRDARSIMLDVRITPRAVHESEDLVVVLAQVTGSAAGGPVNAPVTYVFRLRDGLIVHGIVGSDPEHAARAFALDEHPVELEATAEEALTPLRMQLTADPESVASIRRAIDAYAGAAGASTSVREDIRLALSEACSNAVMHAYIDREPGVPPGNVTVTAGHADGFLYLDIEDDGRGMSARSDSPGIGVGLLVMSHLASVCTITTPPKRKAGSLIHLEFPLEGA